MKKFRKHLRGRARPGESANPSVAVLGGRFVRPTSEEWVAPGYRNASLGLPLIDRPPGVTTGKAAQWPGRLGGFARQRMLRGSRGNMHRFYCCTRGVAQARPLYQPKPVNSSMGANGVAGARSRQWSIIGDSTGRLKCRSVVNRSMALGLR